jgi:hypothetical protein
MPQPSEWWLNHFETLHSEHHLNKEQNKIIDCLKNYEKIKDNLTELDDIITEEAILESSWVAPNIFGVAFGCVAPKLAQNFPNVWRYFTVADWRMAWRRVCSVMVLLVYIGANMAKF